MQSPAPTTAPPADPFVTARLADPARTEIRDPSGALLAEMTDGSRTVAMAGPTRAFREPGLGTQIVSDRWVRLLPAPYDGTFDASDRAWLSAMLSDRTPDILAVAFQYVTGAPDIVWDGHTIAGDASYGPVAGADFYDYLGVEWKLGSRTYQPDPALYGALDCSGFVRMVFGYRFGLPMSIDPSNLALPRRAKDQVAGAPGRVLIANSGTQVTRLGVLRPGDLVFFDASDRDGPGIDHVGIYVGVDAAGNHRFISSRRTVDGPTIGDVGGASVINGSGYWAAAFRAVRRL